MSNLEVVQVSEESGAPSASEVKGGGAGRFEDDASQARGRIVPALVLGEQRYPDPSVWGPDTDKPLMQDERYLEALAFLDRVKERRERD